MHQRVPRQLAVFVVLHTIVLHPPSSEEILSVNSAHFRYAFQVYIVIIPLHHFQCTYQNGRYSEDRCHRIRTTRAENATRAYFFFPTYDAAG
jgi:hypothetical protein